MRHLSYAALTVAITCFGVSAEAQTGWTGTVTNISEPVVTGGWLSIPVIAVEPNGNAYAIWNRVAEAPANTLIQASQYIAATDSWGTPMTARRKPTTSFHCARVPRTRSAANSDGALAP